MRIVAPFLIFAIFISSTLGQEHVQHRPICTIAFQTDPPTGGYPLVCIDGTLYFELTRTRLASDAPVRRPWKSKETCGYFELMSMKGETTIKNLGSGDLNEAGTTFIPKSIIDVDRSPAGFLGVDYTGTPPSVIIQKNPGKFSKWKIDRSDKQHGWYIENLNDSGKPAWLSMDRNAVAVVPLGRDAKSVVEYRRAVLSFESKPPFRITIQSDESK
ncbi:MAG: hypothetical protein K8T91_28120 [Planctomycetes bacterium]|nr:hypothetical protein [Planctomycetota bacterium]